MRIPLPILIVALVAVASGCGSDESKRALPQDDEPVSLAPGDFGARIDNPYFPLLRGSKWVYQETDGEGNEQRIEVTVTDRMKTIAGIEATVVHDLVTEDGEPVEDTYDWYAQDKDGNVWYLGEDTKELENGKLAGTKGSWEAGVDGAQAGIVMPANPEVGMAYRQEYYEGEAEDRAEVIGIEERARVPFGAFENVVETMESNPLEPGLVEHKYYAKGVGTVLAVTVSGGSDREELLRFTRP